MPSERLSFARQPASFESGGGVGARFRVSGSGFRVPGRHCRQSSMLQCPSMHPYVGCLISALFMPLLEPFVFKYFCDA